MTHILFLVVALEDRLEPLSNSFFLLSPLLSRNAVNIVTKDTGTDACINWKLTRPFEIDRQKGRGGFAHKAVMVFRYHCVFVLVYVPWRKLAIVTHQSSIRDIHSLAIKTERAKHVCFCSAAAHVVRSININVHISMHSHSRSCMQSVYGTRTATGLSVRICTDQ